MDFSDVVRRRRMVRSFRPEPLAPAVIEQILAPATRVPSAGHAQGVSLIVLHEGRQQAYWDTTLPPEHRAQFPWPGLLDAPVLVVVAVDPGAYVERYGEADKRATGLGADSEAWPQPMWFVDGGMAVMAILYAAAAAGVGACFFGVFDHETALRETLAVPSRVRLVGTVALGMADPAGDRISRSAARPRRDDVVRFGRWR
ncbi:MAG: nitroreductase family protein [Acidimicrobiales bacterium]